MRRSAGGRSPRRSFPLSLQVLPQRRPGDRRCPRAGAGRAGTSSPAACSGSTAPRPRSGSRPWLLRGGPLVAPTALAQDDDDLLYVLDAGLKPLVPPADPFVLPVAQPAAVFRVDLDGGPTTGPAGHRARPAGLPDGHGRPVRPAGDLRPGPAAVPGPGSALGPRAAAPVRDRRALHGGAAAPREPAAAAGPAPDRAATSRRWSTSRSRRTPTGRR